MSLKCIASVLSLAFACSSQLASADMVPIDRRLLMETFGSVPEEEHFDAEAFYAQLGSQLLASSGEPPPGDYTVQGSSIDFENALEADAAATRFLMISPSVSVIVLEDLTVPTNTVNTIDCNGAALDLRDSGLDMSHTLNLYGGIIVLPFQISEGKALDYQWFVQDSHMLVPCEEDSAASHFQLAALMGSNGVELLVSNSTVRCLKQPHMNSLVHFLLGPQSQHKSGSSSDSNSTWIIIVAVSSAAAATAASVCVCICCFCFKGCCARPLKLYTEDPCSFPPPPDCVQQHVRIDAIRDSLSVKLSECALPNCNLCKLYTTRTHNLNTYMRGAESGPAPTSGPHTQDPLQVHSQNTAHSGGVTTLHQRSCPLVVTSGNDCTCTPGSSTGPKSDSLHLEADAVGVPHRVPIHSEDSHNSHSRSPSGSVCASTPRFVGSHSQSGVLGPGSSGRIRVEGSLALQEHDVHPLVAAEQHVRMTPSNDNSDTFLTPRSHDSTSRHLQRYRDTQKAPGSGPRPQTMLHTTTRSFQNDSCAQDSIASRSYSQEARLEEMQLQQMENAAAAAQHAQGGGAVSRAYLLGSSSRNTPRKSPGTIDSVPIVPSPPGLQVTTPFKSLSMRPQDVLHSMKSTIDADGPPGVASISPRSAVLSEEGANKASGCNAAPQNVKGRDSCEDVVARDLLPHPRSADVEDERLEGLSKPLAMLQSAGHGALDSTDEYSGFPTMPTLRSFGEATSEAAPTDVLMDDGPQHVTGSSSTGISDLQWHTCVPSPPTDDQPSSTVDGSISLTIDAPCI